MATPNTETQARLRAMVDEHSQFVTRKLRYAGVPESDLDDGVQRTFIAAAARLADIRPGAERKFLAQVAINVAWHTRRTLARRREVLSDEPPDQIEEIATPENLTGRKQMQTILRNIVNSMHETLRPVFILQEFEGMNLTDIASFQGVPRGTVASRLRRARVQFRSHAAAIELASDLGADVPEQSCEVARLRCEKVSRLEKALLRMGRAAPASGLAHTRTLAVLGLSR
jgi:RNA polymerase sigma-70 factor, ECF subfamily